jgi:hypothetical protein
MHAFEYRTYLRELKAEFKMALAPVNQEPRVYCFDEKKNIDRKSRNTVPFTKKDLNV